MSVKGRSPELRGIKPLIELSYIAAPRSFVGWHGKSLKLTKSRKFFITLVALLFNCHYHCSMWQKFNFEQKIRTKTCKRQKFYQNSVPLYHSQINTSTCIIVQCAWNDKKLPNSWMETIPDTFSSEWVCKSPFICPFMTAEPDLKAEITR